MKSIDSEFPIEPVSLDLLPQLKELPQLPKQLFMRGKLPQGVKFLTIVGSRAYTSYGKAACEMLIEMLRGYPVCIVSGLALGMDALAHKAALKAGLPTIAFPGSGLNWNVLYPRTNQALAAEILTHGGALLSEFNHDFRATPYAFPRRNRLVAGIADAVLIIEATEKSGTLITARLATEYNKNVLAVPGSIFSNTSKGTNWLIARGAVPARSAVDILQELGLQEKPKDTLRLDVTENERKILEILSIPLTREEVAKTTELSVQELSITLTMLEIKGLVTESLGKLERIA